MHALKAIKNNKATGPDDMRGEIFKTLADSKISVNTTKTRFNNVLTRRTVPYKWKLSKTIMMERKTKPTVSDLYLTALLDLEYKLFMAILKEGRLIAT